MDTMKKCNKCHCEKKDAEFKEGTRVCTLCRERYYARNRGNLKLDIVWVKRECLRCEKSKEIAKPYRICQSCTSMNLLIEESEYSFAI